MTWYHETPRKNVKIKLLDTDFGNNFLDMTPKLQVTIAKINIRDYIKLNSFHKNQKKPLTKWKDKLQNGKKMYVSYISDKELTSKTYKGLL